jgi:cytochrome c553
MLDFLPAARITTALSSLVRPARVLARAGLLCAGEAWCAAPDTIAERMRPCGACHGRESVATADGYSPRIAGKPAGYLLNQLRSFRDGRRTYAPMVYLVQYMSDAYLREIADYFAALELPYPAPQPVVASRDALARGQALGRDGDRAKDIPACRACHGDALTGAQPAIPALIALPRDYVNAQLLAWRTGRLRSLPPDCMADVARRMSPDDIVAVSAYLASQPVPADARPVAALPEPMPLECGGVAAAGR